MLNTVNLNKYKSVNNHANFSGWLKQNLELGYEVLTDFKQEFGYLRSSSYLQLKKNQRKFGEVPKKHRDKNTKLIDKLEKRIDVVRDIALSVNRAVFNKYSPPEKYIEKLRTLFKKRRAANCRPRADFIHYSLLQKGKKAHVLGLEIKRDGSKRMDHYFPVFDLKFDKKDFSFNNPETWGESAVTVDAWAKRVMKAQDGIDFYKKASLFDPKFDTIEIFKADRIKPLQSTL